MTFEGKVVAITGAAGGVGQSLCRYFIDQGAKIAAIDKNASVENLAADLKAAAGAFSHFVADVGKPIQVSNAFASLTHALGSVDILFNNAGGSDHSTLARTDPAGWQLEINGNLNGAYHCSYAVIPSMLTRSLAQEYGRFGFHANIVLPGTVRTPLWQRRAAKNTEVFKNSLH